MPFYIMQYEEGNDFPVSETEINIKESEVQELFFEKGGVTGAYPIKASHVRYLSIITSYKFDLDNYEYHLQCFRD